MEIPLIKIIPLGPLHIQIWGLMVGLGMFIAYLIARPRFKKRGLSINQLETLTLLLILSGLIGARLLWVFIDLSFFLKNPLKIFTIWEGGMAFTGGFFLALFSMFIYLKKQKIKFWIVADALALPLIAGMAIGRFGCLFTGLHTGIISSWGPVITQNGISYLAWPAYAILNWIIAFGVLSYIEKKPIATGTLSRLTLLWWGFWRFGADFLRSTETNLGGDARIGGLTPTQYLALMIIVIVIIHSLKLIRPRPQV